MKKSCAPSFLLFLFLSLLSSMALGQNEQAIFKRIKAAGKFPGSNTVVIFDSTGVDVKPTGLSYVHIHQLIKILTPAGALEFKAIRFGYDPQSAFVEMKQVRIFKKDGAVRELPLGEVIDYAAPARGIYWGARGKMLAIGRLEPGDAVEILVFRKGFTYALLQAEPDDERYIPPMKGHFYDIVAFYSQTPIIEKVYRAALPADKPLQYEVYNGELRSSVHFTRDQKIVYSWSAKDIKPFKREPNMVAVSDVAPKLLLSTAPDWNSKALWFYNVNEEYGSFEFTPEIKKKTDEIISGAKTEMEKISRLTHWVAEEIRYSGLSMGQGEGYTLHKGAMTFRDRSGVCKDKAGMLVTMLRAAGFESYAAMTMAGSRIDYIPADQFNHSVTLVKKSNGEYMLLDPTWVPGVRELWSSAEQQQQYLMGIPETADLKTTPLSPPEKHYYRIKGKSKLKADGALEGSFTLTAEGQSDARIRRIFLRSYKANWQASLESFFYRISSFMEIKGLKYTDPTDISKPMKITVQYQIPNYAIVDQNHILFTPLVAKHPFWSRAVHDHLFTDIELESRQYGFRTRCSKLIELSETVELPAYKKLVYLPEAQAVDGSGASFSGKFTVKGRKLEFTERVVLKKRLYEPGDYPGFRDVVKAEKKFATEYIQLSK